MGFSFIFVALSNNVRTYRGTLTATAARISSGEKKMSYSMAISNLIKKRATDIQRIQRISVDPKRPLQFIEIIEQIGRATNVKILLTVDEKKDDAQELLFHATLRGNEKDVRAMFALVEQLPYRIKIVNISFQRDSPAGLNKTQDTLSTMTQLTLTIRVATQ